MLIEDNIRDVPNKESKKIKEFIVLQKYEKDWIANQKRINWLLILKRMLNLS